MISICVPAYNEEKRIRSAISTVVEAGRKAGVPLDIIIVNDGSHDRTGEIIDQLEKEYESVRALHHKENCGLGINVKDALALARYPKFMIAPGDNDAPLELLISLFRLSNKADLVMSYYLNREVRSKKRNTLSLLYNIIYMCTFGIFVQYINGVTLYATEKLKRLDLQSRRFSIVAEMNVKMLCSGSTYYEVGGYSSPERGGEGSTSFSMRNLIEVICMFSKLIWEIRFRRKDFYNKRPLRVM